MSTPTEYQKLLDRLDLVQRERDEYARLAAQRLDKLNSLDPNRDHLWRKRINEKAAEWENRALAAHVDGKDDLGAAYHEFGNQLRALAMPET